MKTLLALALPLLLLAACGAEPAAPAKDNHAHDHDHGPAANAAHGEHAAHNQPANAPAQGGHMQHNKITFNWDELKPPAPSGPVQDLLNAKDPVTLKPIAEPGKITVDYKGYRVHFESEATRAKFNRKSLKYLNSLSLEPQVDGSVKLVDAANWVDCVTETCPLMEGSEVDPHGTVYLLHRGFKIFFCCWTGCGDGFMQDPAKYYDWYGLVEKDGRLQLK